VAGPDVCSVVRSAMRSVAGICLVGIRASTAALAAVGRQEHGQSTVVRIGEP
jgi:hypothetical protein